MSVSVSCPGCGAAVEFKIGSSLVKVCEFCRSVVARGDRNIEDLGKVAALADTNSALELGLTGKFQGQPFTLTGRAQFRHSAGGVWDEWYASFPHDQWGWIAEAQGRYYLTFSRPLPYPEHTPPFEELGLGQALPVDAKGGRMVVAEIGTAAAAAADGEIPYRLVPGAAHRYADLSGPGGTFATLSYEDETPDLYTGVEVTLDQLGIPLMAVRADRPATQIAGHHVSCPNCGAALELRAPDRTERVVCPSCNSLLDCSQGTLRYLEALKPGIEPYIPLGSVGTFDEGKFTVTGFLQRCVTYEGIDYFWDEYLLYEPQIGFRWLVQSDGHWSYVRPVAPGDVSGYGSNTRYKGERFKIFQRGEAAVTYVLGEFFWKVHVGEMVATADFIRPPEMLSRETTLAANQGGEGDEFAFSVPATEGEVNFSLGTYLPRATVEKAFGLTGLPTPRGVAPHQPFGYKNIYLSWALLAALVFAVFTLVMLFSPERSVLTHSYAIPAPPPGEKASVIFTEPFDLDSYQNIEISVESSLDNAWVGIGGDLVNESTGLVQPFDLECERFHGFEDGEAWSEGSNHDSTMLSAVPEGKYSLRLEVEQHVEPNGKPPSTLKVQVRQGIPRWGLFFLALLLVSAFPLTILLFHLIFEYQRWKDSDYSPFRSSEE
jgi:hypothetical protein